jgi:hypothetical protein
VDEIQNHRKCRSEQAYLYNLYNLYNFQLRKRRKSAKTKKKRNLSSRQLATTYAYEVSNTSSALPLHTSATNTFYIIYSNNKRLHVLLSITELFFSSILPCVPSLLPLILRNQKNTFRPTRPATVDFFPFAKDSSRTCRRIRLIRVYACVL